MGDFEDFWNIYPNQTGIGAARSAWSGQIFFHKADPLQIVKATKAFKVKHKDTDKKFIPRPSKYLQDQTYLDPDLNVEIVDRIGPDEFWHFWRPEQIKEVTIIADPWQMQYIQQKREHYFELAKKLGFAIVLKEKPR
jgi:hypothetical protein